MARTKIDKSPPTGWTRFAWKKAVINEIHIKECRGTGYGENGDECPSWECDDCNRPVGYCMGNGDEHVGLCNDCWAKLPVEVRDGKKTRAQWEREKGTRRSGEKRSPW